MHLVRRALRGELEDVAVGEPAAGSVPEPSGGTGPRARLFVALELPEPVRAALADWRDAALARVEGLRPVADESLHATLCFLGGRPEGRSPELGRWCAAAPGAPARRPWRWASRCGCRAAARGCWPWG